jgi:hypothetical protein
MQTKEFRIFAILLIVLLGVTESFLAYNTLYTQGEVMQGLYSLLVWANLPLALLAWWTPRNCLWAAFGLGALLIPWQAYENRKWAYIHEDVIAIIQHVEEVKKTSGKFPEKLDAYTFKRPWVEKHVLYGTSNESYSLDYFMHNIGTSYWYKSKTGFGYYPD